VLTHCHSAWGLPTYDPRCLEVMLFLHVCKVKWRNVESNYAYSPHSGSYPHLRVDNEVAGAECYPDLLAKLKPDCSMKQEDKVLVSYVRRRLNLVNDYCFWKDDDNKVAFANVFKSRLSILCHIKAYLFGYRRKEVDAALKKNNICSRKDAMKTLQECLQLLETRLDESIDNTFANGGFSELDCAVGAQLLIMKYHQLRTRYTNLENSCLLEESYPQLSEFLKRIRAITKEMQATIKTGGQTMELKEVPRQRSATNTKEKSQEDKEADRKSRMFLMGCFITVVAYCYIFKPVTIEIEGE